MGLLVALVFVGVFSTVALVMVALGPSRNTKVVQASLESALATESRQTREDIMNLRKDARLSNIPWLNRKLLKFEVGPYIHNLLSQADLKWNAGKLMLVSGICFFVPAYAIFLRFGSMLIGVLVGFAISLIPFGWAVFLRGRRFGKFEEGLPEALDLMVSAMRAGHSLIAAMGLVSRECPDPVGSEFKICFDEQNYGLELKSALENMLTRMPLQDLKIVATAILIQKESGGNLAEVLDKTAHVIRERFRLRRQVQVHTAQGRLTGWILTFLPAVLGVALYFINPGMISILWHRSIGIKLMWGAAGMTVLGGVIIHRIVNLDI
jgi:tight adherence protein B